MKSAAYWEKRFEMLEEASHAMGQETLRELQPAFDAAERGLRKEITMWFARFAQNNNVSYTEAKRMLDKKSLKELKWDVQQYIKAGEENGISGDFTKELENASARVHISRLQEIQIKTQMIYEKLFGKELQGVTSMAENILASDYYHTCFELMKGYGIGWRIGEIAQNDLAKIIIIKPWTTDGRTFSDRIWSNKNKVISELHQELSRTLILGKSPDEAIERMSSLVGKSVKNARAAAVRLVQTEQAYFHSVSTERAFKDLDVEEFEIVATLDTHTSEICQDMDGQHFKMKDYEIGVTVPPFHPNCRSVVVPYFDDLDETSMRAARNADGKTYLVPADMKYKDWRKQFVKGQTEDLKPSVSKEFQNAFNGQVDLLKQYGNVANIMLKGSSEDLMKWSELQKITNLNEKDILKELSKDTKGWETILASQTEEKMQPFVDQLLNVATDEELGALNLWTGETYANINRYLRYGINVDPISKKAAHDIEAVLNKTKTPEEIIVKRGTGTKEIFAGVSGDWKNDPTILIGHEFHDSGFTATSPLADGGLSGVGETQAELFIRVPKGTHGAYIAQESHNEFERELLLQRGYSYRIINAEYRNNPIFPDEQDLKVWCEVIFGE